MLRGEPMIESELLVYVLRDIRLQNPARIIEGVMRLLSDELLNGTGAETSNAVLAELAPVKDAKSRLN